MRAVGGRAHGQVREEGNIIRTAGAFVLALALLGCGHPASDKKSADNPSAKADQSDEDQVVNTQAGTAVGRQIEGQRLLVWRVGWNTAKIVRQADGNTLTEMKTTNGTFMQNGKDASTFQSARGIADKNKGVIDVDGQVVVVSLTQGATMHCDHIHYATKGRPLVQATGNVRVDGTWGTVTGLQEVWATPDLKVFGTPDLFQQR